MNGDSAGHENVQASLSRDSSTLSGSASPLTLHAFPEASFVLTAAGTQVFFSQYIHVGNDVSKTDYAHVESIHALANTDGMLSDIVAGLGLLALAQQADDRRLVYEATSKYSHALRQTQVALKCPVRARSDEAVATVALLALHERVSSGACSSVHLDGAAELLKYRGKSQFETSSDRRLFARLITPIVLDCLYLKRPVPRGLIELSKVGKSTLLIEESTWLDVVELAARLCDIISTDSNVPWKDHLAIYEDLVDIERCLSTWPQTHTDRFDYFRRESQSGPKCYDTYRVHIAASVWNAYRCLCIETNAQIITYASELIVSRPGPSTESFLARIQKAKTTIQAMSQDICYSIPFFMSTGGGGNFTMYGCSALLVPLFYALREPCLPQSLNDWAISQLGTISRQTSFAHPGLQYV